MLLIKWFLKFFFVIRFRLVFLPTNLTSFSPRVMLLNRSNTPRDSATDIERTFRKGAPERERPNRSLVKEQWTYIKIKCLRGNTMPIITDNLRDACGHYSIVVWRFKQFQEWRRLMKDDAHTGHPLLLSTTFRLWSCPHYLTKIDKSQCGRWKRHQVYKKQWYTTF